MDVMVNRTRVKINVGYISVSRVPDDR